MTRDDLLAALSHDNVSAFLRLLRQGESNQDETAYRVMYGGRLFDAPPWNHPNASITANGITSTAAGAYQFLYKTWTELQQTWALEDFSPPNQDLAAVALLYRCRAIDPLIQGNLDAAIQRANKTWASLPGSPYGQGGLSLKDAHDIFAAYGGRIGEGRAASASPDPVPPSPTPAQEKSTLTKSVEVPTMGVLAALLPAIFQMLPQLIPVLSQGHDSPEAKQWQGAGTVIANTLQTATNTDNIVQAVAAMQTNPDALAAAHAAVNDLLPQLVEAGGGGIDGARKASADPASLPFWKQPAFVFLILSVPLVYMLALSVLFGLGNATWSDDAKMMVATGILAVLAGGSAYFWGSSSGSAKKTDALVAK